MANYWAITIGINQYRHFQPLMHAQDDALLVHRFLTEDAGIPANHCALLSDLTTSVTDRAVYPDKPAITQWLQTITEQVGEEDIVWFFFSGYGAQVEGKDYLMPIDGNPDNVQETGISVQGLIETLTHIPSQNRLLMLDMNRAQGALPEQTIGTEVIELAEARSLTTLLSCQPEQYSHETLSVRHGLFTAALLEALHQARRTPAQISEYLNKRVPELCEHHWRPIQNPVLVVSDEQAQAELVPERQETLTTNIEANRVMGYDDSYVTKPASTPEVAVGAGVTGARIASGSTATAVETVSGEESAINDASQTGLIQPPYDQSAYTEETVATGSYRSREGAEGKDSARNGERTIRRSSTAVEEPMAVTGAKLRNWSLLALALLMGGVLLKQPFVQTAWQGLGERIGGERNRSEAGSDADATVQPVEESVQPIAEGAEGGSETEAVAGLPEAEPSADLSGNPASGNPASEPAAGAPNENADAGDDATASVAVDPGAEKAKAQTLIAQANAAIEQRQYSEALIALQDVPRSQRDADFSNVLTKARTGAAEAQQTNASVLTEARTSIQPTQASQFTEAIAKARLIQPGEPYYEAAQRDIRSWSQVILDIAEGRATGGNLEGAIAAANVMPQDNAEYHQKAQDRIAFWQQRQNSRKTISEAQTIPKLGQASTYQKGIVKLREVPIEHPEYETAQRLADQWSQSIFSIAQARAAQGRQNAAIQAAILVPAGTTAYEPTQQAIRRWRSDN